MRPIQTRRTFIKEAHGFHDALLAADDRARAEIPGYKGHRFRAMLKAKHGFHVAKELLKPLRLKGLPSGFVDIIVAHRPDLTMEAVVLERRWQRLFGQHEIDEAIRRFRLVGFQVVYQLKPGEAKLIIKPIDKPQRAA